MSVEEIRYNDTWYQGLEEDMLEPMCLYTVLADTYLIQMENKRVQVTFNLDQWKLISKMKGSMGNTDADIVRNIVLAWLAEKSFISEEGKRK